MNRYRAGLHVPGNVLVACRRCNSEKRRDDGQKILTLADSGWASFLSHDGTKCSQSCASCKYWRTVWTDGQERAAKMKENAERIRSFRSDFKEFAALTNALAPTLSNSLATLYLDCQSFAQSEITSLLSLVLAEHSLSEQSQTHAATAELLNSGSNTGD